MLDRMSPKGKSVFMNSIIVITVMLFIFGYFIGKTHEGTKNKTEQKPNEETKVEDNEGFSYSDLNKTNSESDDKTGQQAAEGKPMDDTASIEPFEDFDPNATREVNILGDFFSVEQINAAKEVAKLFIQNYYPFNGGHPTQHIENASPYVTEEFKRKITGQIVRPTSNYFSRNIIKLEVYEPYNPSGDMILNTRVEGEIFNSKGESVKKEVVDYGIKLVSFENTFKVSEYTYTTLNRGGEENAE